MTVRERPPIYEGGAELRGNESGGVIVRQVSNSNERNGSAVNTRDCPSWLPSWVRAEKSVVRALAGTTLLFVATACGKKGHDTSSSAAPSASAQAVDFKSVASTVKAAKSKSECPMMLSTVNMPVAVAPTASGFFSAASEAKSCECMDGNSAPFAVCTSTLTVAKVPPQGTEISVDCLDKGGAYLDDVFIDANLKRHEAGDKVPAFLNVQDCWSRGGVSLKIKSGAPGPKAQDTGGGNAPQPSVPETKPEFNTPLDALASDAESSSFSVSDDDAWALYPPGTSECGTDVDGHVVYLDRVKADDEFAAERLKKQKPEIAKKYLGHFVAFKGSGNASGGGFSIGRAFKASLGKYNFATHQYVLTIKAEDESKWPLSGQTPNLAPETLKMDQDREIAKLGGKSLTVKGQQSMTHFLNQSSMPIPIKIPVEEAEEMKSSAPTDVLLVMRIAGLGYHKQCTTDCSEILGTRTCSGVNEGFGQYYRADLVGYRVLIKDKVVAEKQPPPGLKK